MAHGDNGQASPARPSSRDDHVAALREFLPDWEIDLGRTFFENGGTSLSALALIQHFRGSLGISLDAETVINQPLDVLVDRLASHG